MIRDAWRLGQPCLHYGSIGETVCGILWFCYIYCGCVKKVIKITFGPSIFYNSKKKKKKDYTVGVAWQRKGR